MIAIMLPLRCRKDCFGQIACFSTLRSLEARTREIGRDEESVFKGRRGQVAVCQIGGGEVGSHQFALVEIGRYELGIPKGC